MKKTLAGTPSPWWPYWAWLPVPVLQRRPQVTVTSSTVVVDVRTSAEYEGGHLQGALKIDVQSPDFDTLIAVLPTEGDYVIYCATGKVIPVVHDRPRLSPGRREFISIRKLALFSRSSFQTSGNGARKDIVIVCPEDTVAFEFDAGNRRQWIAHCHSDYHAERGMIGLFSHVR